MTQRKGEKIFEQAASREVCKCRQVLIVILGTFLEVIKSELKHQHIAIFSNTQKEGEYPLLNVSLLFYFIFYMRLQGVGGKSKVKVKKRREEQKRAHLN